MVSCAEDRTLMLWERIKALGYVSICDNGCITLQVEAQQLANTEEDYYTLIKNFNFINQLIELGLIAVKPDTFDFEYLELTE